MVASRENQSNPARIPALGLRTLALIFISMALMYVDKQQNHLDTVRQGIGAAMYPLQVVVDAPVRLWSWMTESTTSRNQLEIENARLRTEQLLTRARLQRLNALEAENERLRALLEARGRVRDDIRVAEILSIDTNPFGHSLTINVGTDDGVFEGQALVDADGVIGQVIRPGIMTSEGMLISDPGHALPVEVNRNGLRTIAKGTGENDKLTLLAVVNNADIEVGDLLVTSGLGGAFPTGYPVAVVETVTRIPQAPYAEVTARPSASLGQVREVMLVNSQQPIEVAEDE